MYDTFNGPIPEGRFDQDMIIANQIFTLRETYIAEWDPNDAIFFFGSGGNNESQRFMTYNRVQLYGTNGIAGLVGDVDGDGAVTISDVTALIDYLLAETPIAGDGDIDGNGNISIGDVTTLIDILLTGGSN